MYRPTAPAATSRCCPSGVPSSGSPGAPRLRSRARGGPAPHDPRSTWCPFDPLPLEVCRSAELETKFPPVRWFEGGGAREGKTTSNDVDTCSVRSPKIWPCRPTFSTIRVAGGIRALRVGVLTNRGFCIDRKKRHDR